MKRCFFALLLLVCIGILLVLPAAAEADHIQIPGETDEASAQDNVMFPLPLDNSRNSVPILILLGLAILCMGFGLIRMCTAKKKR